MLVKNWMSKKVITVGPDESMQDAIYILQEQNIKILPVMDKKKIVGIITDRDLKKASPSDATTLDMHELLFLISKIKVRDLMKKQVYIANPDDTVEEAAAVLLEKKISGVPVVDENNRLLGIITRSDIFRVLISLTGMGKKGVQFAIRIKDMPGPINEVRELIHEYGARTASILSSWDNAPPDYLNIYFRVYRIDRQKLPLLLDKIKEKGTLLYMVDHREDKRTVYEL
ncbi:MAG: acetoin utilization protein AcuB [Desulfobacteraceae bacterium Eth-SRB2]|nr:MAG: acetoin utilization protein AcuB [Desulfobacteraceae bacterium Eth-SRB2]